MDYEKKYNKALATAKNCLKDGTITSTAIDYINTIFPELKNEDERIRKEMITAFSRLDEDSTLCGVAYNYKKWIAWLEKQESVGEIVERCKNSWYNEGKIAGMAEGLTNDEKYQQGWHDALEKQGEQKPTDKVEHECSCKYVGCHINNSRRWCHYLENEIPYDRCNSYCPKYNTKSAEWSDKDE